MGFYVANERQAVAEEPRLRRQVKTDLPLEKSRPGFFSASRFRAGFFASQPVETHRETESTPTIIVPGMSCWLSRDPIGEKGGKNLYVFVMNNAIYLIDARGHSPKDVIKIYRVYRTTVNAMTSAEERNPNPVKNGPSQNSVGFFIERTQDRG